VLEKTSVRQGLEVETQVVKLCSDQVADFLKYINDLQMTNEPCKVVLLPGYQALEGDDDCGFGAYNPEQKTMWVVGDPAGEDIPADEKEDVICETIAHEYIHHIQNIEGREFSEQEAERQAEDILARWLVKNRR
jgi:hypothetical protein